MTMLEAGRKTEPYFEKIVAILEKDAQNWPERPDHGPTHVKSVRELVPGKDFILHIIRGGIEMKERFQILPSIEEAVSVPDRRVRVLRVDEEARLTFYRLPFMGLIPYEKGELFLRKPMEIYDMDRVVILKRISINYVWSANWVGNLL